MNGQRDILTQGLVMFFDLPARGLVSGSRHTLATAWNSMTGQHSKEKYWFGSNDTSQTTYNFTFFPRCFLFFSFTTSTGACLVSPRNVPWEFGFPQRENKIELIHTTSAVLGRNRNSPMQMIWKKNMRDTLSYLLACISRRASSK